MPLEFALALLVFQAVAQGMTSPERLQDGLVEIEEPHVAIQIKADCATVENPADDQVDDDDACGPLACARVAVSRSTTKPVSVHDRNKSAASNLKDCLSTLTRPGNGVIVGHGSQETIYTGLGVDPQGMRERVISSKNPDNWSGMLTDELGAQGKTSVLTLLGCSTGAGQNSARFLGKIRACAGASAATAPTEDVFCADGTLYFLGQEHWTTVPPVHKSRLSASTPARKGQPKNQLNPKSRPASKGLFSQSVIKIHVTTYEPVKIEFDLTQQELSTFLKSVVQDRVLKDSGCPMARKIGRVTLSYDDPLRTPLVLTVFSNGLLHDLSRRDTQSYYLTLSGFLTSWNEFMSLRLASDQKDD